MLFTAQSSQTSDGLHRLSELPLKRSLFHFTGHPELGNLANGCDGVLKRIFQCALHGLNGFNALDQFVDMLLFNALDAGAAAVVPQADQFGNLGHRKTHHGPAIDELPRTHAGFAILTVAAVGT